MIGETIAYPAFLFCFYCHVMCCVVFSFLSYVSFPYVMSLFLNKTIKM